MKKQIVKEVAILDFRDGSVNIYTLPEKIKSQEDLEDYVNLELTDHNDFEWMSAKKIKLVDFRVKK